MKIKFYKYHGTGNDFIMVDNRSQILSKNDTNLISRLCHRRFGIGADGLILLEQPIDQSEDFKMVYFNADGKESSMCGNGGRCLVAFAEFLNIIDKEAVFTAIDGQHEAIIEGDMVSLKMKDVQLADLDEKELFLNTGSPHKILFSDDVEAIDVKQSGAKIRYSELFKSQGGTNVNFVQQKKSDIFAVRTYERGVEDETFSCGTGVTAVALAVHATKRTTANTVNLETPGGKLKVSFERFSDAYRNIWLTGPTEKVFKGEIEC